MAVNAIPTLYRGIEYRSRLEARWAAFFDEIWWDHTYEPFDGDGYIPDFVINGPAPLLVEVKPALTVDEYQAPIDKVTRGVRGQWRNDIIIVGMTPVPDIPNSWGSTFPVAGLLGEYFPGWSIAADGEQPLPGYPLDDSWEFSAGMWFTCRHCRLVNVFHNYQSYGGRPCGHHDGDHYMGHVSPRRIEQAWAEATNSVKWRGTAA